MVRNRGPRADDIRPYTRSWGKKQKAFPWGKVARRSRDG